MPGSGHTYIPDPSTYMIARFMSFYKPGVTEWYQSHIDCWSDDRLQSRQLGMHSVKEADMLAAKIDLRSGYFQLRIRHEDIL